MTPLETNADGERCGNDYCKDRDAHNGEQHHLIDPLTGLCSMCSADLVKKELLAIESLMSDGDERDRVVLAIDIVDEMGVQALDRVFDTYWTGRQASDRAKALLRGAA